MEVSFSCIDDGHDLVDGCHHRRLWPRNSTGNWGNAPLAALAVHLLAIFFSLALMHGTSTPPATREQVVVVQLTQMATRSAEAAPSTTARLPETPVKITPAALEKPLPPIEKKQTQPPAISLKEALPSHKGKKTPTKPDTPAATVSSALAAAALSIPTENVQRSVAPVVARQGAGTTQARRNGTTLTTTTALSAIEPRPINQPKPTYPPQAQRRGLEGKVILQVTVGIDGAVRAVTVSRSSSHSLLDEAAVASIRDWHFQPGQMGGERKEMTIFLPVDFRLR